MKYSVIIPTKNNPDQVQRCLDSIPSDSEIEILVCDDHSDYNHFLEIRNLSIHYPNVRLIESEVDAGAGHARNMGLAESKGEWIIFSDSDDYFNEDFWNKVDKITECSSADIIYFFVQGVYSDSLELAKRGWNYRKLVEDFINGKKNAEERLRFYHMVPWGKVFRRAFIEDNQIKFDEVRASNDVMFNVRAGSLARKVEAFSDLMYFVTISSNSLTKKTDRDLLHCRFNVLIRHYKYVMSLGKPQCAYNMIRYAIRYSKPYGLKEFFYYVRLMIKNRVNPFISVYKIGRYN